MAHCRYVYLYQLTLNCECRCHGFHHVSHLPVSSNTSHSPLADFPRPLPVVVTYLNIVKVSPGHVYSPFPQLPNISLRTLQLLRCFITSLGKPRNNNSAGYCLEACKGPFDVRCTTWCWNGGVGTLNVRPRAWVRHKALFGCLTLMVPLLPLPNACLQAADRAPGHGLHTTQ